MNSIRCPSCNTVNWSSSQACVRCKSSLSAALPSRREFLDTQPAKPSSFQWRGFSANQLAAAGVGLLILLGAVYKVTKPAPLPDPQNPDGNAREMYVNWSSRGQPSSNTPESLGVVPLNLEVAKDAAIRSLGDGEWTPPNYRTVSRVIASGGTPGTPSAWQNVVSVDEEIPGSRKKMCSRTIHGARVSARYERDNKGIVGIAIVEVDQSCTKPDGTGLVQASPRGTITVEKRYRWRDRMWSPITDEEKVQEMNEQAKKDSEEEVRKGLEEDRKIIDDFKERQRKIAERRALRATQNGSN